MAIVMRSELLEAWQIRCAAWIWAQSKRPSEGISALARLAAVHKGCRTRPSPARGEANGTGILVTMFTETMVFWGTYLTT
jgi:hypothetical protein